MEHENKYDLILDSLKSLLINQDIQKISVNDIAKEAGIGKGSIYYYFPSKEAIVDALIERTYKNPIETAKKYVQQRDLTPHYRMAKIFEACQKSSKEFMQSENHMVGLKLSQSAQEQAYLHQKYLKYIIAELKPSLAEIIKQSSAEHSNPFIYPEQLAEIILIVLSVKLDNTLVPSSPEEIETCMCALTKLLETGCGSEPGALDYLTNIDA